MMELPFWVIPLCLIINAFVLGYFSEAIALRDETEKFQKKIKMLKIAKPKTRGEKGKGRGTRA